MVRICGSSGALTAHLRANVPSMTAYRMGQAAELLGVSTDTVRRWADAGRLPTTRMPSGRRVVDGEALAELARTLADETSPGAIVSASARNRFTGIVTRVVKDTVMAQVELQAGPHRVGRPDEPGGGRRAGVGAGSAGGGGGQGHERGRRAAGPAVRRGDRASANRVAAVLGVVIALLAFACGPSSRLRTSARNPG